MITDPIPDCIKKTLKKIAPDVKVSSEDIKIVIVLDVIKREVFEDEKAEEAKKKINIIFKASGKKDNPSNNKVIV